MKTIDFEVIIPKFDALVARGFCSGVGTPDGQMCVEAAITQAMGLPFNVEPECVEPAVRAFKIALNDAAWSSAKARAEGMRNLGIAQIGSAGVVNGTEFAKRLSEAMIRKMIPFIFRKVFPLNKACLDAADTCEKEGTWSAAESAARLTARSAAWSAESAAWSAARSAAWSAARSAAWSAESAESAAESAARSAAWSAESAAWSAARSAARSAAWSAESAAWSAARSAARSAAWSAESAAWSAAESAARSTARSAADEVLVFAAKLALEVLRDLKSPGCNWI